MVLLLYCSTVFKFQYMAGAGAKIRGKGGAGANDNNFGYATLHNMIVVDTT